ncbi:MAG: hypothetical protein NVS3B20_15490 [Polyangiales bacterium]
MTTWDLNLEGGYGAILKDAKPGVLFGRARGGVMRITDYSIVSVLGVTCDLSSRAPLAFGLQGELLHLELGLWVQGQGLIDLKGHPGASVAVGFSLLGVELQTREYDDSGRAWGILGKLRLPVSLIYHAFQARH